MDKSSAATASLEMLKFPSGSRCTAINREFDPKDAAAIQLALDDNAAAIPFYRSLRNGEPKTDPAATRARSRFVDTKKRLEDFFVKFGRNAVAGVAYRNVDVTPAPRCRE